MTLTSSSSKLRLATNGLASAFQPKVEVYVWASKVMSSPSSRQALADRGRRLLDCRGNQADRACEQHVADCASPSRLVHEHDMARRPAMHDVEREYGCRAARIAVGRPAGRAQTAYRPGSARSLALESGRLSIRNRSSSCGPSILTLHVLGYGTGRRGMVDGLPGQQHLVLDALLGDGLPEVVAGDRRAGLHGFIGTRHGAVR